MRAKYTSRLARAYKDHLREPGAHLIRRLLIESISPQEKVIYSHLANGHSTSRQLANELGLRLVHTSTTLARLHKYGLLGRVWDSDEYCFVYFQAAVDKVCERQP